MKFEVLKNYFENIKYCFLYRGGLYIYPYCKKMDKKINEFISEKIIKIECNEFYLTLFFENNYVMKIWIANRWYAFASDIIISQYKKEYKEYERNNIIYEKNGGRPSYKTLYILKQIYLNKPIDKYLKISNVNKKDEIKHRHGKIYNKITDFLKNFN